MLLGLVAVAAANKLPTTNLVTDADAMVQEACPDPNVFVNSSFRVNSIPVAAGWEFDVGSNLNALVFGKLEEDLTAFDRTLIWRRDTHRVATGKMMEFEPGKQIKVVDCNAVEVAIIKNELYGRSTPLAKFQITAPDGNLVAVSNVQDWTLTTTPSFVVSSVDGKRALATMVRTVQAWGQQWEITRHVSVGISAQDRVAQDPRVLAMVAAFLTASKGSDTKSLVWFFMISGPIVVIAGIYFCVRAAKAGMFGKEVEVVS